MVSKVKAKLHFRGYDDYLLPIDVAQKIQMMIADHAEGYRERYVTHTAEYHMVITNPTIPQLEVITGAPRTSVDAKDLNDKELDRYLNEVFVPFADSTDRDAVLMNPVVWRKLALTKGE